MVVVKTKKVVSKKAHEAKKFAKLAMVAKLGSTNKLVRHQKVKKKRLSRLLTLKMGKVGHQQKKSLPRGKFPKIISKWWKNSDPPLTLWNQMKRKRKTWRLLTF
jgi:hypothetical protein